MDIVFSNGEKIAYLIGVFIVVLHIILGCAALLITILDKDKKDRLQIIVMVSIPIITGLGLIGMTFLMFRLVTFLNIQ